MTTSTSPTTYNSVLQTKATHILAAPRTQQVIIGLILINALILGLETSKTLMASMGNFLHLLDRVLLTVFVIELVTKLYVYRAQFFRNAWNIFDFLVIAISLVPASGPLAVLRVLRLLRLVSLVPKLRFIVEALFAAIPGILSILGLLLIVFYVFAIIATGLFGETHPQWFGTLGKTLYTLFQVMTLESWSMGISRPIMETYPWAGLFFVLFILIATFTMLNLFIALIVNAMQTIQEDQKHTDKQTVEQVLHQETEPVLQDTHALREEVQSLREEIRLLRQTLSANTQSS